MEFMKSCESTIMLAPLQFPCAGYRPAGTATILGASGAGGADGDRRSGCKHRSGCWRSELLGQKLVDLDLVFDLKQPRHPLPSESLE